MQLVRSTVFQDVNAAGVNLTPGRSSVVKMVANNGSAAIAFLQFFDAPASGVVIGTTPAAFVWPLAATTGFDQMDFNLPWTVDTQLSVFSTTAVGGGTGSAAGVQVQIWIN